MSQAFERLLLRIEEEISGRIGEPGLTIALGDFLLWPEDPAELEEGHHAHRPLFIPWLIFDWQCDPEDYEGAPPMPPGTTMAEMMAADPRFELDSLERSIVAALRGRPHGFYEVVRAVPGRGLLLRDILLGGEIEIFERTASRQARPGEILFGRWVRVNEAAMLVGASDVLLPPACKPEIIRLRSALAAASAPRAIGSVDLIEKAEGLRELYFKLYNRRTHPPVLVNHDGEPLAPQRLHFRIDGMLPVFEALQPLAAHENAAQILDAAERGPDGKIRRIVFHWSRPESMPSPGIDPTILGTIRIDERRLLVEVDSRARAERIRAEIDRRLGRRARYRTREIIPLQPPGGGHGAEAGVGPAEEPELRAKVAAMLARHWRGWIDTAIPALGGVTPREAVKEPDGRESVEALLRDAELSVERDSMLQEGTLSGIAWARRELGIA